MPNQQPELMQVYQPSPKGSVRIVCLVVLRRRDQYLSDTDHSGGAEVILLTFRSTPAQNVTAFSMTIR
jgi:hypothetical protein